MINQTGVRGAWYLSLIIILSTTTLEILGLHGNRVFAQSNIVPDDTLGRESSRVVPLDANGLPVDAIRGGATRGINLFHSFKEFNVGERRGAYFINTNNNLQNILTRVTGNNPSNILGTLGIVNDRGITSNPNLFLINPNGIIFGENARLDVSGSFVGTTADGIQFGDRGFFSATEPEAPQLLTVNPSALFFNQVAAASIQSNSARLQVSNGQNLFLVGGNIDIDTARLTALGGRIEIGGLSEIGTIGLSLHGNNQGLSFPDEVEGSDIILQNFSIINTAGSGGGNIGIHARNLNISGSGIFTGIRGGVGNINSQAGNIELNSTKKINIDGGSLIWNIVGSGALGNAGNINVKTRKVSVNNAILRTATQGTGNGGKITIEADEKVSFDGGQARNIIESDGVGNSGDISITSRELSITNGGQIASLNFGQGNLGNVNINIRDIVLLDGVSHTGLESRIRSEVDNEAKGNSGSLIINTGTLSVKNGGRLASSTFGEGNAGNILIQARNNVVFNDGDVFSTVEAGARGQGGNLNINAGKLSVINSSELVTATSGQGDAGKVVINARDIASFGSNSTIFSKVNSDGVGKGGDIRINSGVLSVSNGSKLLANTSGQGDAGNVIIDTSDNVSFDAGDAFTNNTGANAVGNGGNISITTGSLFVSNGGQLVANTSGQGNAGNIIIKARDTVSFDGEDKNISGVVSAALSSVEQSAVGSGGNIKINTDSLLLANGAQLLTDTLGKGDAGNITIHARNRVLFNGVGRQKTPSGTLSDTFFASTGQGGDINITAGKLSLTNGALVNARSFGRKKAGNIFIDVNGNLKANDGEISTRSFISEGGAINITAKNMRLFGDSKIRTDVANGTGSGGDITLTADTIVALDKSDILSFSDDGKGGDITFKTEGFFSSSQFLPASPITNRDDLNNLDENNRVDVNASGIVSGNITGIPDTTFIQDSLTELPENQIDTNALISQSCIARSDDADTTFIITGSGGFPQSPGNADISNYPTNRVRGIPKTTSRQWKKGDPIMEPDGVYRLADGRLALSRECG